MNENDNNEIFEFNEEDFFIELDDLDEESQYIPEDDEPDEKETSHKKLFNSRDKFDDIIKLNLDDEETDFSDDHTFDQTSFDIVDSITNLDNSLSFDIIMEKMDEEFDQINYDIQKINYPELFRQKYLNLKANNLMGYSNLDFDEAINKMVSKVLEHLKETYGIELGTDIEFYETEELLKDVSALYDFLFVRNYINVFDYLYNKILKMPKSMIEKYAVIISDSGVYNEDIFVSSDLKKFENKKDTIIYNFIKDIINDFISEVDSGFSLFNEIVNYDLYEETNNNFEKLLFEIGNKLVFNEDYQTGKMYFNILKDQNTFNKLRNELTLKYLENHAELAE